MRVFKLAQSWKTMRVLLSIIVSTLGSLANLTAILGIIMFIFAAMGKQLFSVGNARDNMQRLSCGPARWTAINFRRDPTHSLQKSYSDYGQAHGFEELRWNFIDFYHAFLMVFRILCGEWIEPLWDCMRIQNGANRYLCMAVFFPTLIMGNFMVRSGIWLSTEIDDKRQNSTYTLEESTDTTTTTTTTKIINMNHWLTMQ